MKLTVLLYSGNRENMNFVPLSYDIYVNKKPSHGTNWNMKPHVAISKTSVELMIECSFTTKGPTLHRCRVQHMISLFVGFSLSYFFNVNMSLLC